MWLSTLSHIWEANLDIMLTNTTTFGRINQATQHSGVIGDIGDIVDIGDIEEILRFLFARKDVSGY